MIKRIIGTIIIAVGLYAVANSQSVAYASTDETCTTTEQGTYCLIPPLVVVRCDIASPSDTNCVPSTTTPTTTPVAPAPTTTPKPGELAFTGGDVDGLVIIGAAIVAGGVLVLVVRKRGQK